MILQDLIRNIVLYKGVIRPYLRSWQESLVSFQMRVHPSLAFVQILTDSRNAVHPLASYPMGFAMKHDLKVHLAREITVFNTITVYKKVYSENFSFSSLNISSENVALNGRPFTLLLEGNVVSERTIMTSKTALSMTNLGIVSMPEKAAWATCSTTGFETEKISSFLFHETHERREYLGEFSLPHEEIQLMYRKERR